MRRLILIVSGVVALFGSFFLTLLLTEPDITVGPPNAADSRSDTERLATQRVSNYLELPKAAYNVGLRLSQQLKGVIDGIDRINEHEVNMGGGSLIRGEMQRHCIS
jgi:hypothetical protein